MKSFVMSYSTNNDIISYKNWSDMQHTIFSIKIFFYVDYSLCLLPTQYTYKNLRITVNYVVELNKHFRTFWS